MKDDDLVIETLRGALPGVVAIYRFGSTATGQAVRGSDVDIAVLPAAPLEPSIRWDLQERLALALHRRRLIVVFRVVTERLLRLRP